jgi:hypothetical protein
MEHRPDVPAESPHRARATGGVERVKRGLAASGEIASAIVSRLMDRDLNPETEDVDEGVDHSRKLTRLSIGEVVDAPLAQPPDQGWRVFNHILSVYRLFRSR